MANQLDLQEQEQLDELKAFWNQWGNLITWALTAVLVAWAGYTGWNYWQRDQASKASAMFDELDRAARAVDADRVAMIFADLKSRYPRTTQAEQGGLLAASIQADKGRVDDAKASLTWVVEHADHDEYKAMARLRLAGMLIDAKQFDAAASQLDGVTAPQFAALAADRRGDLASAQGRKADAITAYQRAYQGIDEKIDYRRLVEAKLTALGAEPAASKAGQP
jgi:predicted negative regulator of RcsB-dependent stress response